MKKQLFGILMMSAVLAVTPVTAMAETNTTDTTAICTNTCTNENQRHAHFYLRAEDGCIGICLNENSSASCTPVKDGSGNNSASGQHNGSHHGSGSKHH